MRRNLPCLNGKRSGDAKADIVEAGAALSCEPRRRTQEFRIARPGAAAGDAPAAIALRPGRPIDWGSLVVGIPAIFHPLRDVAPPGEYAPGVRLDVRPNNRPAPKLPLRTAGVSEIAVIVCLLGRDRGAPPERRLGAGPGRIFPFGLAQQPVGPSGLLRQPRHV